MQAGADARRTVSWQHPPDSRGRGVRMRPCLRDNVASTTSRHDCPPLPTLPGCAAPCLRRGVASSALVGELVGEAREPKGEGLHGREGVLEVEDEVVLARLAKLHEHLLLARIDHLHVLHGGHAHAAGKVERVLARGVVVLGLLGLKHHEFAVQAVVLVAMQNGVLLRDGLVLHGHAVDVLGQNAADLARGRRAHDVLRVEDDGKLLADALAVLVLPVDCVLGKLLGVVAVVIEHELRADEVGAELAHAVVRVPREVLHVHGDDVVVGV
mmetsp:Transcript_18549/g.54276  ORF Transcript_18549/g.54276 Transcript_18549/m.54276 type:complete len:269 (+) Transcript_18549:296-1102(+)